MDKVKYTSSSNILIGALLNSTNRVEAPFVCVTIGGATFGVYLNNSTQANIHGVMTHNLAKYPNFVQSIEIKKINGTVNLYTIRIEYPVTLNDDPNFFDKLFGTILLSRIIKVSYGDSMLPEYIYSDEEAIITGITENVNVETNVISYEIKATSTATLTLSGCFNFQEKTVLPSEEIYNILYRENNKYHLLDVFTGMRDEGLVRKSGLIAIDDSNSTFIPTKTGISALEYISLLVNYMTPASTYGSDNNRGVYSLTTYEDKEGVFGGPYFKILKVEKNSNSLNQLTTYVIDVGYPTANIVTNFSLKNLDNWSIYYNYNRSLGNSDYIRRIDDRGKLVLVENSMLTNTHYHMDASDLLWWYKVTEFPIQAEITIKGLLKPAILMTYVKLNVFMYGRKHVSSGYYIITSQVDKIDGSKGYYTTLGLTKVAADEGQ